MANRRCRALMVCLLLTTILADRICARRILRIASGLRIFNIRLHFQNYTVSLLRRSRWQFISMTRRIVDQHIHTNYTSSTQISPIRARLVVVTSLVLIRRCCSLALVRRFDSVRILARSLNYHAPPAREYQ